MKKAKNKKIEQPEETFRKNEVMMMLESMNDGIKIIAENQTGLRDEFVEFKEEMHEFKEEMYEFKTQTEGNFRKVFKHLFELDDFKVQAEANFKAVLEYLSRIEDEIMDIKKDLRGLDKSKVDKKDFLDIVERVEKIEKELARRKTKLKAGVR